MAVNFSLSGLSITPLIQEMPFLVKYAASSAINDTAFDFRKRVNNEISKKVHMPRKITRTAGFVFRRANKDKLQAEVGLKDFLPKGTAPDLFLRPLIYGGDRNAKRAEKGLVRAGKLRPGQRLIFINENAPELADTSGDIRGSKMVQILSSIQGFAEQGFRANIKNINRAAYFLVNGQTTEDNLHPGIYKWTDKKNKKFKMVFLITDAPFSYRKKIRYFEQSRKAAEKTFPVQFVTRFRRMANKRVKTFNLTGEKILTSSQRGFKIRALQRNANTFNDGSSLGLR